jgi:hypothetical protein
VTLATLRRSTVTPLQIPVSAGRKRVQEAAAALQEAIDAMFAEDKAKALARERERQEGDERAKRAALKAQARQATRSMRIEVPRAWFWDFSASALEAMKDLVREARKQGQRGPADALQVRIDEAHKMLDRIQTREAAK